MTCSYTYLYFGIIFSAIVCDWQVYSGWFSIVLYVILQLIFSCSIIRDVSIMSSTKWCCFIIETPLQLFVVIHVVVVCVNIRYC